MNVENAVRRFLASLIDFLKEKQWIRNDEINTEIDEIDIIVENIKENTNLPDSQNIILNFILDIIKEQQVDVFTKSLNESIRIKDFKIITESNKDFRAKLRSFAFSDSNGAVICRYFFEKEEEFEEIISGELDFANIKNTIFELIIFLGKGENNKNKIENFLDYLFNENFRNSVIIIFRDDTLIDVEELYSFLYFKYLAYGYRTLLDVDVVYNYHMDENIRSKVNSLNKNNLKFNQFFEILDVLDEYHHSTDVLMKFLKLYQIIEYLLIRVILVKIQQKTGEHKHFIRELMKIKKQEDFDKKLFRDLFETERNDLMNWFKDLVNDPKIKNEIEKYVHKGIDTKSNDESYWLNLLADLFYQLRNSIVHNKESEYHLTIHTLNSDTINLLKNVISKMETIILKKIIKNDVKISYQSRELKLY